MTAIGQGRITPDGTEITVRGRGGAHVRRRRSLLFGLPALIAVVAGILVFGLARIGMLSEAFSVVIYSPVAAWTWFKSRRK